MIYDVLLYAHRRRRNMKNIINIQPHYVEYVRSKTAFKQLTASSRYHGSICLGVFVDAMVSMCVWKSIAILFLDVFFAIRFLYVLQQFILS